ncbi:La- protein 4 [Actinomortierella wolfii]|nr:La- protein 4 [Actinomortierella wolfii]
MQGFSGDSPYTTSTFASPSPTALPTSNPTYPSDLNSIGNPIAPVARFSTPWGYVNFAPSPTSGQSGLLGHEATVQTQFSGHQEGYQPTLVDDQDDVEVVLGNPDRISETESTASNGSNAKRVEIMALEVSQMDKEQFIPISVIAGFKKVKALTSDVDEIVKALQKSPLVIVNEEGTMVKPNIVKRPRTTLILRDLPLETTEEEIRQLFESGQCSPKTITKEVGNNWFVDFATEEEALAMLAFTRGKCIRDVPIAGRLKSTTALAGVE